jgi:hypothetical protein
VRQPLDYANFLSERHAACDVVASVERQRLFASHLNDFADGLEGNFVAEIAEKNSVLGRFELDFLLALTFDGANGENVFHDLWFVFNRFP